MDKRKRKQENIVVIDTRDLIKTIGEKINSGKIKLKHWEIR